MLETSAVRSLRVPVTLIALALRLAPGAAADEPDLSTVAERSDFRATSKYADVMALCRRLAERSPRIRLDELGETHEGRSIPLLWIADPPLESPGDRGERLLFFAFGNIHAGEVCGKAALLMLAREFALAREAPLLKNVVIALAPIYNADGNERFSTENRPGQNGPADGMGTRQNAQGLDLNRDFVKLEAPETRALVRFLTRWDPEVILDTHTTNGSYHRYPITYAGPKNPAGHAAIIEFVRDEMLPGITRYLRETKQIETFYYGNFPRKPGDHSRWTTYPDYPRYGTPYRGVRNRLAILSEAYAYDSFHRRVETTLEFTRACLEYAAGHRKEIRELVARADRETTAAGQGSLGRDLVTIQSRTEPHEKKVEILGYVEEVVDGKRRPSDEPMTYEAELVNSFVPSLQVTRPAAYLIPARFSGAIENLQRHGVEIEELREDVELDVEIYTVDSARRAEREDFRGHRLVQVEATLSAASRRIEAGTLLVRTAQPLGSLIVKLLEPESDDGLTTWNFFDDGLKEGELFPVSRLDAIPRLTIRSARPLEDEREFGKRLTFETLYESKQRPNLSGQAVQGLRWLDDDHYLQTQRRRLWKVHAPSGRSRRMSDHDDDVERMRQALASLPSIDEKSAGRLARNARYPLRPVTVLDYENDLYVCRFDDGGEGEGEDESTTAFRLTNTPEREELHELSPDGTYVSFVRENDLWVVDVPTQTERRLTSGGEDRLRNGKADWVYFEELYHRSWKVYWWSPDSARIAFLQVDSHPVKEFVIVDDLVSRQRIERVPFPKPGEPNPRVRLGVVTAAGGDVRWTDLSAYDEESFLISGVGWFPDSKEVYCYVQNRIQTWLDFCAVPLDGSAAKRLLRDETEAWIEAPTTRFLDDGSFLMTSERSGWNHIYRYSRSGELVEAITAGDWEVRRIHLVDTENGWIYFSGTRDNAIAANLYRVRTDGSGLRRLTWAPGSHSANPSPKGRYFIDTWSDLSTPTRVALRSGENGRLVRMIDTNPVYEIEEYRLGDLDHVRIRASDGFEIEALLIKPPDFSPHRKYPVWFSTYAGPSAPTVRDTWSRGRTWERMLAEDGFVFFRCDPRSASGKGAVSAWKAYRQLGVSELEDIEDAIRWLTSHAWVDASRIGMSGHSYGGFMTAYAMTHSELFAAGIAGSPVTDWRDYDSIYTERYMSTPQDNPEGYRITSAREAAASLHGRLLLIHGNLDDNVHFQNTTRFVRELQKANKSFEIMIYPDSRHGIHGRHYRRLTYDFIRRTLGGTDEK